MSLVSIILTTLNSERFVARSIESCLNQTHASLELIVVDGGSQDRTLDILNSYNDSRIRVIHQRGNMGKLPGAINLGMANARGDFITWAQDDCWYEQNAVETMLQFLNNHPSVALVYTDYWDVDETGARIRYQLVNPPSFMLVEDVVRQCFLFRREVYHRIGPQETKYFPVHEVPWRMRVASCFEIQPLHMALMYYTLHPNSLTGRYRSAFEPQHLAAKALLREGYLNAKSYRRRLARIHIDEAFDEFILKGNFSAFKSHAFAGVKLDSAGCPTADCGNSSSCRCYR
jgi:glycosyltransferase involved in cell wall biosynthesis